MVEGIMSRKTKEYLRILARELITNEMVGNERDFLWDEMDDDEQQETNELVEAIFKEWL